MTEHWDVIFGVILRFSKRNSTEGSKLDGKQIFERKVSDSLGCTRALRPRNTSGMGINSCTLKWRGGRKKYWIAWWTSWQNGKGGEHDERQPRTMIEVQARQGWIVKTPYLGKEHAGSPWQQRSLLTQKLTLRDHASRRRTGGSQRYSYLRGSCSQQQRAC